MRAPLSWPNHLPKAPPPNTIILGVRFLHMNLEGHKPSIYSKNKIKCFFKRYQVRGSALYQRSANFYLKRPGSKYVRASLVAQWLRIHLPMQATWVRALVREDPTCRGATKPMHHNYRACALEPSSHNYWARAPRVCALQQDKPPQWEAHTLQWKVAPARRT